MQLLAAGFAAVLTVQGWQVRMLYRLNDRLIAVENTLEFNGMRLPTIRT